ncbi:MAG: hypothetical protein Q8O19_06280, partial [Rectinemataceae bacterium]|nr:hypothetical protein [Rectinemataceae bacterium]
REEVLLQVSNFVLRVVNYNESNDAFWKSNSVRYNLIHFLLMELNNMIVTEAAVERSFRLAGTTWTVERNRMSPSNVMPKETQNGGAEECETSR